jgi:regulator of replication initiation timing
MLPNGIKRKDLAKHMESCPLEMVQCPIVEVGCGARVLRKDLNTRHMQSNTQQHLMKMMTAYNKLKIEHDKLSSQIANQTFIEPVKLTDDNSSFTFNITSSQGSLYWMGTHLVSSIKKIKSCLDAAEKEK